MTVQVLICCKKAPKTHSDQTKPEPFRCAGRAAGTGRAPLSRPLRWGLREDMASPSFKRLSNDLILKLLTWPHFLTTREGGRERSDSLT